MKPRGQSLITKGIQAFRKGVSLATKGVLDRIGIKAPGGEPEIKTNDWIFKIKGIKQFQARFSFVCLGTKVTALEKIISFLGKKLINSELNVLIKAILQSSLKYDTKFIGRKFIPVKTYIELLGQKFIPSELGLELSGIKEILNSEDFLIKGAKQYNFDLESSAIGIKQFIFNKKIDTQGIKELDYNQTTLIKGKRDITPILVALDMLEGGE